MQDFVAAEAVVAAVDCVAAEAVVSAVDCVAAEAVWQRTSKKYFMGSVMVCRRQDHNLEMEAAVAGLPPPAVAQDGEGAPPGDLPSCNICDKTFKPYLFTNNGYCQLLMLCCHCLPCVSPFHKNLRSHIIVPSPYLPGRRPLLGPSARWKQLLPLSHLRHY